jgi:protein SCO1/2
MIKYTLLIAVAICLLSCKDNTKKLPIMGERTLVEKTVDGKKVIDTLFHQIGNFKFQNQDGKEITEKTVEGKVYIADFFFTACPSICPKVKSEMLRVYSKYSKNEDFVMLSYSIDPKRDTVGRLAWYANRMNIKSGNWHLLTGKYEKMTKMAAQYLLSAQEDPSAPGGFDHSGYIALIDRKRQIRGFYDGTDPKKVDLLIKDIAILLKEK